jgi:hypothetical protein
MFRPFGRIIIEMRPVRPIAFRGIAPAAPCRGD